MSRQAARSLTVATVAMTPDLDPGNSRDRIQRIVEETKRAHPDVRLILFGETILGWFYKQDKTRSYHESIAEGIPGPSTDFMAELAKEHDVYISSGLSERGEGKFFNSQVLIAPDGEIVAKHRKFRIRNKVFSPGDGRLTLADIDGVKVALLICADMRSLRLRRMIRRAHVDVVLVSLADYATDRRLNQLMGAFYDAWAVVANRYGEEPPLTWHGLISISDPWGRLVASSLGRPEVLCQRIRITRPHLLGRGTRRLLAGLWLLVLAIGLVAGVAWKGAVGRFKRSRRSP